MESEFFVFDADTFQELPLTNQIVQQFVPATPAVVLELQPLPCILSPSMSPPSDQKQERRKSTQPERYQPPAKETNTRKRLRPFIGRPRGKNLPTEMMVPLIEWYHAHLNCPYPTPEDKLSLSLRSGMTVGRVARWFVNIRSRYWRPRMNRLKQPLPQPKRRVLQRTAAASTAGCEIAASLLAHHHHL
jgi:hypothetical protein